MFASSAGRSAVMPRHNERVDICYAAAERQSGIHFEMPPKKQSS